MPNSNMININLEKIEDCSINTSSKEIKSDNGLSQNDKDFLNRMRQMQKLRKMAQKIIVGC